MENKEIKLNQPTIQRLNKLNNQKVESEKGIANIFLTILEHEAIDYTLYDVKYESDKLTLIPKEDAKK